LCSVCSVFDDKIPLSRVFSIERALGSLRKPLKHGLKRCYIACLGAKYGFPEVAFSIIFSNFSGQYGEHV